MLLARLMWIVQIVAVLFGAGTRGHPVCGAGKPSSRIAFSELEDDMGMSGDIEDGFCVQPQSDYAREMKVDEMLNCASKKSSWTMSHLKGVRAVEELIKHKGLAGLLSLKHAIRRLMPRKAIRKYHEIE